MKIWTLLTSTAALFILAGFSLLGAPPEPSRPRTADPASAARRYRLAEPSHWRDVVLAPQR